MKPIEIDKGTLAQGGVIPFFIGAMIATLIGLSVAWPVMDGAINGGSGASATLTFSGNVTCNQLVNVTNGAGTKAVFEFNITSGGCTAANTGFATVTLGANQNTSTISATNLTTALNANATVSGTMTASNPSAGVVTLTYDTHGAAGNLAGVVLAEGVAGTWSGTTLSNGVSDATTMPSAAGTIVDQLPLFLVLILLMVFVKVIV